MMLADDPGPDGRAPAQTKVGRGPTQGGAVMTSTEYIQVTHRELPYPTFDADNHMYENQ